MPRENKSKHAVLAMLSLGPRSGYDIERDIRRSVHHFWNESYGQIYPTLRRLVDEGLASVHEEPQESRPDRKIYTITRRGRVSLRRWLEAPSDPPPVRNELLLKLFVGWNVPPQVLREHVNELLAHYASELAQFEMYEGFLEQQSQTNPDALYWLLTVRSGQLYVRARLQWCEEALPILDRIESSHRDRPQQPAARSKEMARIMAFAHQHFSPNVSSAPNPEEKS